MLYAGIGIAVRRGGERAYVAAACRPRAGVAGFVLRAKLQAAHSRGAAWGRCEPMSTLAAAAGAAGGPPACAARAGRAARRR